MRHISIKLPLLLAASATIAVGQEATTTGSSAVKTGGAYKCAAQKVVDECVRNMKFQLENCAMYDWDCQCTGSTNVVGCYSNCPENPDRLGAQQIREQSCANAKAYDTTSSASASVAKATGMSSSMPSSMSASSSASAADTTYAPSGLKSNSDSSDAEPTKSLSGLEKNTSPSEGAAAVRAAGGWLAFLGLALGVMF
ncbi:uncharacterized protein N7482_007507 [Penicillium canariense]|uniref:GPI anchored serine-threonine rich protein n=1 Tax=Penicillium canariense TaxID=189055 RepID=A0A9W9LKD0_9EURO|nr:uncharacterized protein N7482_007507 [Penicillium canariense]KAJ5160503.1 hypothetical protein N7482_007507 [Penicillium canariense]